MAKFQYTDLAGGPIGLGSLYSTGASMDLGSHGKSKASYLDEVTGNRLIFFGEDLKFKGERMTGGTIDKIEMTDHDGNEFIIVTNADYKAATLGKYLLADDLAAFFHHFFLGDDKILGSNANDYLIGAANDDVINGKGGDDQIFGVGGRDTLTGGTGSDLFIFSSLSGVDIITDFDADGTDQDRIETQLDVLQINQAGAHTIIEFENGGIIKLLNVDATTIVVGEDII
ncbi:hypothetical protein [Rhizobium sp. LjRoot254]|uniref:hypothetical protein n=1 Tax=Rhizobium sp. LjRoot254 TaxID=3342297 RepID=UPI003ECDEFC1